MNTSVCPLARQVTAASSNIMTNEKAQFWERSQSETFAVLCMLWALPSQLNPRVSLGNYLGVYLGLWVCPWLIRAKHKLLLGVKLCDLFCFLSFLTNKPQNFFG